MYRIAAFCAALIGAFAAAAEEARAPIAETFTAVSGATVWPNLTRLPGGTLLLAGFNKPSHGQVEGDVACWASTDEGRTSTG